jgi:TRAP-type C4-dicarboxylate transport system permease small subunit
MDRMLNIAEGAIRRMLALLLAFITIGTFVQVVLRYTAGTSFLWAEELSVFAFIWCIFLGAVINVRRRTNFAFDLLGEVLPRRVDGARRLLVDLIALACCLVLLKEGLAFSELSIKRHSPALGISLFGPTIVIPATSLMMALVLLIQMARDIAAMRHGRT